MASRGSSEAKRLPKVRSTPDVCCIKAFLWPLEARSLRKIGGPSLALDVPVEGILCNMMQHAWKGDALLGTDGRGLGVSRALPASQQERLISLASP